MRIITLIFCLIVVAFELACAKFFDQCEFAVELFETHEVPREEIFKHLCIVTTLLQTSKNVGGHLGIYSIGRLWWCREDEPGGSCNVKCSDLIDDDIADDVACANLILSQQGVEAFGQTLYQCKITFEERTNECLANVDIFDNLVEIFQENTTIPLNNSTTPTTVQKTSKIPKTSIASHLRTFRPFWTSTLPTSTTSTISTQNLQTEEPVQKEGSDAFVWIIVVALIVFMITLFALKFKKSKSSNVSYRQNHEFENAMDEV